MHLNHIHNALSTNKLHTQSIKCTLTTHTMNVIQMRHKHNPLNAHELSTQSTQDTWATHTTHSIPMNHLYNALNIWANYTTLPVHMNCPLNTQTYFHNPFNTHFLCIQTTHTTHSIPMIDVRDALNTPQPHPTQYTLIDNSTYSIHINHEHNPINRHEPSSFTKHAIHMNNLLRNLLITH
jgi:hypothetical protein